MISTILLSYESIGGLIAWGIILLIAAFVIVLLVINKIKNNKVLEKSFYIHAIKEINKKYEFKVLPSNLESKTFFLKSKRAFDNFDYEKKGFEYINENLSHFVEIIQAIDFNVANNANYKKEINLVPLTSDGEVAKSVKLSLKSFNKRETKLGAKLLKTPQMDYCLKIKWEYTSPAGRNHYYDYCTYDIDDLKGVVRIIAPFRITPPTSVRTIPISTPYPKPTPQPAPTPKPTPTNTQKVYTNDDIEDIED